MQLCMSEIVITDNVRIGKIDAVDKGNQVPLSSGFQSQAVLVADAIIKVNRNVIIEAPFAILSLKMNLFALLTINCLPFLCDCNALLGRQAVIIVFSGEVQAFCKWRIRHSQTANMYT